MALFDHHDARGLPVACEETERAIVVMRGLLAHANQEAENLRAAVAGAEQATTDARRAERTAVVAWLRKAQEAGRAVNEGAIAASFSIAANAITRGEHAEVLTPTEQAALKVTGELANLISDIVGHGVSPEARGDQLELTIHIHAIQNAILAQAAARAYPGHYRLLGQLGPGLLAKDVM